MTASELLRRFAAALLAPVRLVRRRPPAATGGVLYWR